VPTFFHFRALGSFVLALVLEILRLVNNVPLEIIVATLSFLSATVENKLVPQLNTPQHLTVDFF
jgi:hypothetical protein